MPGGAPSQFAGLAQGSFDSSTRVDVQPAQKKLHKTHIIHQGINNFIDQASQDTDRKSS